MDQFHKFLGSCTTQLCTGIGKHKLLIFSMAFLDWADSATHSRTSGTWQQQVSGFWGCCRQGSMQG